MDRAQTAIWIDEAKRFCVERFLASGTLHPMADFVNMENECAIVAIDGAYMESAEAKDNLMVVLCKLARKHKAIACALCFECWRRVQPIDEPTEGSLEGKAGTVECLVVHEVSHGETRVHIADIHRTEEGKPSVLPWRVISEEADMADDSRFAQVSRVMAENYRTHAN